MPINKIKGRNMTERDIALSIPFDKTLGYTCPKCLSVGIGAKWAQGTNYCPKCGQKIKLIEKRDWPLILKDAEKIPDVTETNIVTTATDFSEGLNKAKKYINGVYMERLKAYFDKNAQIEGQMSIFDL